MQTSCRLGVMALLVSLMLLGSAQSAFAGNATVTNNGTEPIVLNIKVDGVRQFPQVQPGETFNVPDGVSKVGFLTSGDVTITDQDGRTSTHRGVRPPTTVVESQSNNTGVRASGENTTVMPPAGSTVTNTPNVANTDIGIGLGPAASDPPVQYVGFPLGLSNDKVEQILDEIDMALNDSDLRKIQQKHNLTNAQMGMLLMEYEMEMAFYDFWSGSGGLFGDCVGTNCMIGVNYPGHPRGGPPIGSWAHFVPGRTMITTDSTLISLFQSGGINDASFRSSFESQFGDQPNLDF